MFAVLFFVPSYLLKNLFHCTLGRYLLYESVLSVPSRSSSVTSEHSTMLNKVAPNLKRQSRVDEEHRERYRPHSGTSSALSSESGEC